MKKQTVAKMLALGMAATMIPATAFAASRAIVEVDQGEVKWDASTGVYYVENDTGRFDVTVNPDGTYTYDDGVVDPTPDPIPTPDPEPDPEPDDSVVVTTPTTKPAKPAETAPVVVETIDNVKTEVNENGQTVVTATVVVEDKTAHVEVSEAAVEALVEQAKEGDVVAIVAETTGAVTAPADQLTKLIETTGNPVSLGNSVAAVAVNSTLAELAGGAEVKVEPKVNDDGTISVPVTAGGKVIAPENVPGGIDVEVPVSYTEDQVAGVNAVKADATEVELVWSITVGKLQVNLTVTGSIKVVLN